MTDIKASARALLTRDCTERTRLTDGIPRSPALTSALSSDDAPCESSAILSSDVLGSFTADLLASRDAQRAKPFRIRAGRPRLRSPH